MAVFRFKAARQPRELAFQLITQSLGHLLQEKSLCSLANGKPNGGMERRPIFLPESLLVGIHAVEDLKARFQFPDG